MADPRTLAALPLAVGVLRRRREVERQIADLPDAELHRLALTSQARSALDTAGLPADLDALYAAAGRVLDAYADLPDCRCRELPPACRCGYGIDATGCRCGHTPRAPFGRFNPDHSDHAALCPSRHPWTPQPDVRDALRAAGHPDVADTLDHTGRRLPTRAP